MEKKYLGRTQKGRFEGSVEINLGPNDLKAIEQNKRNGWVRLFLASSKDGNPYTYILPLGDESTGREKVKKAAEKEDLGF